MSDLHGRSRAPAGLRTGAVGRWAAAALVSLCAIAVLWALMFALLANWRPGMRVAEAPALATERARAPAGDTLPKYAPPQTAAR